MHSLEASDEVENDAGAETQPLNLICNYSATECQRRKIRSRWDQSHIVTVGVDLVIVG